MSHDFENFSEGDWENRGELAWSEFDWQQYLKQNEKEIARFLALYLQYKHEPTHLDTVAKLMEWGDDDWAPADDHEARHRSQTTTATAEATPPAPPPEDEEDDDEQVYTIHRHPVFIATRGLYQHIYQVWEHFMGPANPFANPQLAWKFGSSLHAGELNAIMAIHALDLLDFTLAICHLKNALSAVNHSQSMLQMLPPVHTAHHVAFFREIQTALFDLREIWLRVMSDCREEHRRRTAGEQTEEKE